MNLSPEVHGEIGYFPEHSITRDICITYRLGYISQPVNGDEGLRNTIVIPYLTKAGVRAIKFRRLHGEPKYDAPIGQQPRLYNTQAFFDADKVIGITEGEIDAVNATEYLNIPSVAIPGVTIWRSNEDIWKLLFKDFRTVFIFADGDEAGEGMAYTVATSIGHKRARVIKCPSGEDVSSMIHTGRIEDLTYACQIESE